MCSFSESFRLVFNGIIKHQDMCMHHKRKSKKKKNFILQTRSNTVSLSLPCQTYCLGVLTDTNKLRWLQSHAVATSGMC